MDPVIASYDIKATVRGPEGTRHLTIEEVTEAVESALDDVYARQDAAEVTVNATATRTDE